MTPPSDAPIAPMPDPRSVPGEARPRDPIPAAERDDIDVEGLPPKLKQALIAFARSTTSLQGFLATTVGDLATKSDVQNILAHVSSVIAGALQHPTNLCEMGQHVFKPMTLAAGQRINGAPLPGPETVLYCGRCGKAKLAEMTD